MKKEINMKEKIKNIGKTFKTLRWYEWVMIAIMTVIAGYSMIASFNEVGGNPPWLAMVNFISAICGIICIFFTAKASISNFIFAIVNTVVYILYLAYWKIYGTMCLEIFVYFPMNFISWYIWSKHRDNKEKHLTKSRKLKWWQNAIVTAVVVIGTIVYHEILVKVGGNVAWLDAATLAIGIIAIFLEAFRFREQYVWWIITDIVAVAMYIVHFDLVYLTKKSIYLIMAVIGLINWIKLNKERNEINE